MINCPRCHKGMDSKKINRTIILTSIEVDVIEDAFVCTICELQVGTVQTAGRVQRDIINTIKRSLKDENS